MSLLLCYPFYEGDDQMNFYKDKDLALCGLACVLCSQEDCPGCKMRGCKKVSHCSIYNCAIKKELDGCYQCDDFPCDEDMLKGTRNRTFNLYARKFGKNALLERLHINYENGITYHKPNDQKGDYDLLETEDDILRLIGFGSHNPYTKCPTLETENFTLRLVRIEDAVDLLKCYSDPKAQELFNSDNCLYGFRIQTLEDMRNCIDSWLKEYEQQSFIRYAIVDKSLDRAVGTIEMFGMLGQYKTPQGVLRLDIYSEYEKSSFLEELLMLCAKDFFILFGVEQIITKAVPVASDRVKILSEIGFCPYKIPEREYYWILNK